jgi:Lamin Tail Domain
MTWRRASLFVTLASNLGCGAVAPPVVINEVSSSDGDHIELFNIGEGAVDLSGWGVSDETPEVAGHRFTFASGETLDAGTYRVLIRGTDHAFSLGDDGAVELTDATGLVMDAVEYEGGVAITSFCRRPNGTGFFEACAAATFGANNDVGCSGANAGVVINEVSSQLGSVELYNTSEESVPLSGYRITDGNPDSAGHRSVLPSPLALASGAFIVLEQGTDFSFGLGVDDAVRLESPDGCLADVADYGPAQADVSWCRLPDGTGDFAVCSTQTLGASNQP